MATKRKFFYLANLSLIAGAALVGYVLYASSQHAMSWIKLFWFWIGCGAIAFFLAYHLYARSPENWQGRPLRRYSLLHRATCALLLILGLFAAAGFSHRTWQSWQLPALYWEPINSDETARDHFEIRLAIGNQRYHRPVLLQEIQLIALSDPQPRGKFIQVNLRLDSLDLSLQSKSGDVPHFDFDPAFVIPPIERREMRLAFRAGEALAIFQINALYQENDDADARAQMLAPYILLERDQATLIEFSELAARGRQPSRSDQGNFIHAVGRSRHPLALGTLIDFLQINDVRIQNLVCEALAMLGDSRAAPALIELATKSKNPQALRALGELPSKTAVDFLIEVLENEGEAFLRAEAAEALGRTAVLSGEKFERPVPTLVSILHYSNDEDVLVQREAILALARINDTLAIPIILDYAKHRHSGQALRNVLDATSILGDKWLLPSLGNWIQDWRGYKLDLNDLQLLLNYLVVTQRRDMVQVLIETLEIEMSSEAQAKIAYALFQLTGNDFGELQHPVLNLATEKSNRQILNQWQKWWKQAQQDSLFREQIKPIG
jgi:HEAT repeat protein